MKKKDIGLECLLGCSKPRRTYHAAKVESKTTK